ncbi:MAG TPA: hypothetical protein VGR35_18460 [Tepidisphaeraceae bacterium]|nr:hypothetical protein [Tepidisphaeraceae bacterium]
MRLTLFHVTAWASVLALASVAWQRGQPVARGVIPATQPAQAIASSADAPFAPVADPESLQNAYIVVADKVISGAQPEGERSFDVLRGLGVKTILSVDGAKPDVETARRYGMRYVHLPIGYDGVDDAEGRAIAKALAELPGPIYLHCHHGRHRSAAAVAVACVNNGMLQPQQAEDVLRTFGTGANYTGLWKAAREAARVDDSELAALQIEWVETAKLPELAEAMVKVQFHWEHIKAIRNAGWRSPENHPDLDPAHEALQLQEHLHEMARTADAKGRPTLFRELLTTADRDAIALRAALAKKPMDAKAADAAFKRVSVSCTSCHQGFRD